jgi:hypothetical protein
MSIPERDRKIAMYGEGYAALHQALLEAPPESLQWRPTKVDWSIHEIIVHCADAEMVAAIRLRQLASEEHPTILAWDQDLWAQTLAYHTQPVELALMTIEGARGMIHPLLRTLDEIVWTHVGRHTEGRDYTLDDWLEVFHDHLHVHAAQIRDNLAHWWEGSGP